MPEITDPALLRALNGGGQSAGGPVYGPPPKPKDPPAPPSGYRPTAGGGLEPIPGGPADPNGSPDKPPSGYRWGEGGSLIPIPGGPADKNAAGGTKATEDEGKTSALLTRIVGGSRDIQSVATRAPDAQSPGLIESMRGDLTPGGLTGVPARAIAGQDRRIVHDAQRDMLDALLTLGTGAAYNAEQLTGQTSAYFPQYGDTADEIQVKNQRLKRLIEAAKVRAGPRWSEIEQAIGPYMASLDTQVPEGSTIKGGKIYAPDGTYLGVSPGAPDGPAYPKGGGTPPSAGPSGGSGSDYSLSSMVRGLGMGVGDIVEGVGDIAGIVGNPLNATINAATGANLSTDLGRTLREASGLPDNTHPIASAINTGGTSALAFGGGARSLAELLNPGNLRTIATTVGARPALDAAAGAAGGGAAEITRESGGGPIPQTLAALAAGGLVAGGGVAAGGRSPRVATPVMEAADRQGVTMLPADVGGVGTRMASGAVGRTLGGVPMAEAAEASIKSAGNARDRVAANIGQIADETGAGQAAQRGAKSFVQSSERRGGELFDRVSVPAKQEVVTERTRAALEQITAGLRSNPELSRLWTGNPRLKATLDALTPKDTREAGAVQYASAADKVRSAEATVQGARAEAENALNFERSQARDSLDQAHAAYDDLLSESRQAMVEAESRADMLRDQVVSPKVQAEARQAANAAAERFKQVRNRDTSIPEVAAALKGIQEAEAGFNNLRFREPGSDEMSAAQDALSAARSEQDSAFVAARQPPQGGKLSWEDMKRLRSIVGEMVGQPGLSADGASIAAMRKFYGALSEDMRATAEATSPRALAEFNRANQFWRGRQDRIDNVLSGILGDDLQKGETAAFEQINRWAQAKGGDFNRLARTMRSMPEEEAATVRASLLGRMGQASPGRQNADGLQFSPAEFATQWNKLSPRAKSVLFPDPKHRADINDLALVMDGMKRAGEFSNFSNTSLGTNLAAHGAGFMKFPITTTLLAAGEFGLGKLLASPKFARWLAKMPATSNPKALNAYVGRLGTIAGEDAVIGGDAHALQERLRQAFSQSPTRAAAEDKEED